MRSLIEVVAVSGRDVSHHVLLRVTGLGDSELTAGMRVAVDSSLLTSGVSSTDVTYGFRHALAREVVYADLLPAQRRRLHARFGHGADRRTSDPVTRALVASEVAEHWWRSGDLPAALTSTVAAAEACRETYAFSEAALHGERAVALWPLVDPDDRPGGCTLPDLLDATTTAWITAGSPGRALTTARSAIEASDATSDPRRRAQRLARLGEAAMFAGDHATAAASLGAATVQLASEGPAVEKAEICALDAELLMLQSNVADACRRAAEAVELAIAAHARRVEGHAKNTWGAALSDVPGGLADATRLLEESLAIARAEGDRSEIDRVHTNLGVALEIAGRREEALALWLTGAAAAERHGSARGFGAEHVGNAIALLTGLGRWDEAEALADRVAPLEVGSVTTFGLTCAIALLRARQGRVIEARDLLTGAQPMLSGLAEVQHLCSFTEAWMEVDLATERPAEAVDAAERALDRLVGERLVAARALLAPVAARAEAELALALRAAAHHSEADAHARRAAEWADLLERESARYETHHERRELRLAATTASAEAARAAGRTLPRVWSDLATDWWRLGWPWQALVAQVRASEALLESGSRGSGTRNALRETLAAAQALGAEPLARRVRQLARQAGFEDVLDATTRPQASAGDLTSPHSESAAALERHGLTEREIQVLTLITEGRSNAQIAAELYISPSTAGVHVSHILSKLQVGNRVQAAAIGARLGLIGDHDASRGR